MNNAAKGVAKPDAVAVPAPVAAWDFRKGGDDLVGKLQVKAAGGAKLTGDGATIDGKTGLFRTPPLPFELKAGAGPVPDRPIRTLADLDRLNANPHPDTYAHIRALLKRVKDDAKEVREGFECGVKITGFDDVKEDDVIEAYRIDIKQRTL